MSGSVTSSLASVVTSSVWVFCQQRQQQQHLGDSEGCGGSRSGLHVLLVVPEAPPRCPVLLLLGVGTTYIHYIAEHCPPFIHVHCYMTKDQSFFSSSKDFASSSSFPSSSSFLPWARASLSFKSLICCRSFFSFIRRF